MATYTELRSFFNNADLKNKISVACVIAAYSMISTGTPTLAQKKFADLVFKNPDEIAQKVLMAVIAANNAVTVAQINNATDAAILGNVNTVLPNLVDALFGV
jgi:hypothetical protein